MNFNQLKKVTDYLWEIPKSLRSDMRVPVLIFASETMLKEIITDRSLEQAINVATLPGIERASLVMPDVHEGYGFPIGGVAAIKISNGVISPGGVGYDINCGVRLLRSQLNFETIKDHIVNLANQIQRDVPSGVGRGGELNLALHELNKVLKDGAKWAVKKGFGSEQDLEFLEENGGFTDINPDLVSERAKRRGKDQVGTLGAGNHFLEIQKVGQIYDQKIAEVFGLQKDQITFLIHTGSRGLGHQVCTDYVRLMHQAMAKYDIKLPDAELACAPFNSSEGQRYFGAMQAAANFAWANRQLITDLIRRAIKQVLVKKIKADLELSIVYDVAHNIAKLEKYNDRKYIVHRKGATRAFGPGHKEIPEKYRLVGQPVLIPGSMGTASYVLAGTEKAMTETFGSTCHGAGRRMSRSRAKRTIDYNKLKKELEAKGIITRSGSRQGLLEEAPQAYKDVDQVVEVVHQVGIAKKVAKLIPLAVIKG